MSDRVDPMSHSPPSTRRISLLELVNIAFSDSFSLIFTYIVRTFGKVSKTIAESITGIGEKTKNQLIDTLAKQQQEALSLDFILERPASIIQKMSNAAYKLSPGIG